MFSITPGEITTCAGTSLGGNGLYPDPPLVTAMLVIVPLLLIVATAEAPVPAPIMVTSGRARYPAPAFCRFIAVTLPLTTVALAIADVAPLAPPY